MGSEMCIRDSRLGNPYDIIGFDEHSEVAIGLGVTGAPETFLIDPEGIIRYKHVGEMNPQIWNEVFVPLIENYTPPAGAA